MDQDNIVVRCANCGAKNRIPEERLDQGPICGKCRTPLKVAHSPAVPVDVTDQTFSREVLSFSGPVLLDCWAPWCGPCKMVAPVLEQLASEYAGRLKIAKLNVDENPATASKYGIQSIPTMLLFKNGSLVNSLVGALPKHEIERHLGTILVT
ncbi:MAG TPA: thioredoxin TrxC [Deltaproteobacteria bacterium]|nr:thioredoxin TrxC [Deltaproteobacteria bacterium]